MTTTTAPAAYPVHVDADLDPELSRGLWLVKWLLAVPHYLVLAFLWAAFLVLSVVAFFAILLTGRYPRAVFDFNVGVMRWSWRVAFYCSSALGTDRYPPFTLAEVPDYPAHLDVDYPERLSRGLVLVKWWLLAIPHYVIVALLAGGAAYGVAGADEGGWISIGLIGALVLVAAVVLLFTGRYPQPIFDLVLGLNRWVLRVAGYVSLMTDQYPPFRLDMGGHESGSPAPAPLSPAPSPAPSPGPSPAPASGDLTYQRPPSGSRWTAGRVVSVVLGSLLVLTGLGLAGGGATLAVVGATERADGFITSPELTVVSDTHAVVSEDAQLESADTSGWFPEGLLGDVRISARSESGTPVFVGIAPAADVRAYLGDVEHATLREIRDGDAVLRTTSGDAPATPPTEQSFWVARATGTDATLEWEATDGDWTVVLMNSDGSAGVAASASTGAELPVLDVVVAVLLLLAGLFLLAGALLVAIPVRAVSRRRA